MAKPWFLTTASTAKIFKNNLYLTFMFDYSIFDALQKNLSIMYTLM